MAEEMISAYCVKCRTKRDIKSPQAVMTEGGRPATRGTCPVCGTTVFRMGKTPAHDNLAGGEATPAAKAGAKKTTPAKK